MRQIFPMEVSEVDPRAVISSESRGTESDVRSPRSWVMSNMVSSLDGATSVNGLSGGLGSEADRIVFRALRGQADVVVAGAATANQERYRLPKAPGEIEAVERHKRGQRTAPRLCVVTRSLRFDPGVPFLEHSLDSPEDWPIIATTASADQRRKSELSERAHVIDVGETDVEPGDLVDELASMGLRVVLCEGGPSILSHFAASGLLDELNLTTSLTLVGGESNRILRGEAMHVDFRLDRMFATEDALLGRYLRRS